MSVDIANESGAPVDEVGLAALARFALETLGIHPLAELSILLVDVDAMERLHERWMGEPGPTDVLAFGMDELPSGRGAGPAPDDDEPPPLLLGDVVLCPEVARRQARQAGHSAADELSLLCVHGVLHLLGYDHGDAETEQQMFSVQGDVLARWQEAVRAGGER